MSRNEKLLSLNDIIIGIPAYKAENELRKFLPHLLEFVPANNIVVVIDGVLDQSEALCSQYGIRTITHHVNQGKGAALMTLFSELRDVPWIITMDADGQHIPEDLPLFLQKIPHVDQSCSIIVGSRNRRGTSMPLMRRFSNWMTSLILTIMSGQKIFDSQCGYRAYRTELVSGIQCRYTRFAMESEILMRSAAQGQCIENVPVSTVYNDGPSHISHVKDTIRWVVAVINTFVDVKILKGNR